MTQERFRGEDRSGAGPALAFALSAVLTLLGLTAFTLAYASTHPSERPFDLLRALDAGPDWTLSALGTTALLTLALVGLHEAIHGALTLALGGRPAYSLGLVHGFLPALRCSAQLPRGGVTRVAVVALAPTVLISALGAVAVAYAPWGGWLILPLALHLGGCLGDYWAVYAYTLRKQSEPI